MITYHERHDKEERRIKTMQENKIQNLTINEVKEMILITLRFDLYNAKEFICIILIERNNSEEEREVLIKAKRLLDNIEVEEARQLIVNEL